MFHLNQEHANQHCVVLEVSDNGLALYGNNINNYPFKCSYQNQDDNGVSVRVYMQNGKAINAASY